MGRGSLSVRLAAIAAVAGLLWYSGLMGSSSLSVPTASPQQSLLERLSGYVSIGEKTASLPRSVRVTIHVFEARSTGVLPLSFPPLEPAVVSRFDDRVIELIRETVRYYDQLVTRYPAAHFELLTAEEGMMTLEEDWTGALTGPARNGLRFQAHDYTIHVRPVSLDASNWLSTEIRVEQAGRFLLGNTITKAADGKPVVIGGPIDDAMETGGSRAVFVGVNISFISKAAIAAARVRHNLFQAPAFERPPRLVELAEVDMQALPRDEEVNGMSIFLVHIGPAGRVVELIPVSSLRPRHDELALEAIKRSRFLPAFRQGRPVDAWMVVSVPFVSQRYMPVVSPPQAGR